MSDAKVDYAYLGETNTWSHRRMYLHERIVWRIKLAWSVLMGREDNIKIRDDCDCDCDDED